MSAPPPDVDAMVRDRFTVKDKFQLPDGEVEYKVEYGPESKEKFVQLYRSLEARGLTPWLTGTRRDGVLVVRKTLPQAARRSRVPVILALLTLASIVVLSLFERITYEEFVPAIPGYQVLVTYWGAVVALLVAHELGRRYVAGRSGTRPPSSYAVPGIPYVTSFLPSLGFVSSQSKPAVNRDKLFDVVAAGPVLTLAVAVTLYVVGAFASTQSSQPLAACQYTGSLMSTCPSAIQSGLDALIGPVTAPISQGYLRFSLLQDAAIIGFLLTFIGLLPMASFDGGHLASLAWGPRAARSATYLGVLALVVVDTPLYWGIAVVVLVLAGRPVQLRLQDEVSGLSDARRALYLGAIVLAFLSVPIPHNLATVRLG